MDQEVEAVADLAGDNRQLLKNKRSPSGASFVFYGKINNPLARASQQAKLEFTEDLPREVILNF